MRRLTNGTERCGRGALRTTALLTLATGLLAASAAPASAADFTPVPGVYTANTTTLKLTGPGGTNITGVDQGGVAVFSFGTVNIPSTVTVNASGSRPFKLAASGTLQLGGAVTGNGESATDGTPGPVAGGPGGGAGGAEFGNAGAGPGGGGSPPSVDDGGGGGGFGGKGARGGLSAGGAAGAGGAPYGDLRQTLQGGSGGGGSSNDLGGSFNGVGGGGGGGGVALFASTVRILLGGAVSVDGGHGGCGRTGASGGGSGGGIVIHGETVEVSGTLAARGGQGGSGGTDGDGGGGGGGRISYQSRNLVATGTALVTGGTTGTRSVTGGCPPKGGSPDAAGANGVVTNSQAASAITGLPSSVSQNGATMNGAINPHSNATTYHFDFGTTTGYGSRVPTTDAPAGADAADHAVSQAVSGLAPNATYHYRLVATDALGFTTNGNDVAFTTPAVPSAPGGGGGGGGGGGAPPPVTLLASTTSINSLGYDKFTKLLNLAVKNLPSGTTVTVTCKTKKKKQQKKGCPYKRKRFTTSGARAKLNLRKPFAKKKVPVGTKITITITAPGFLGKQVQYTTRAGKIPKSRVRCLSASGKAGACA